MRIREKSTELEHITLMVFNDTVWYITKKNKAQLFVRRNFKNN